MNELMYNIWERRYQDLMDWKKYLSNKVPGGDGWKECVRDAIAAYEAELRSNSFVDFSLLEAVILERITGGSFRTFFLKSRSF